MIYCNICNLRTYIRFNMVHVFIRKYIIYDHMKHNFFFVTKDIFNVETPLFELCGYAPYVNIEKDVRFI